MTTCRAFLLAEMVALADGVTTVGPDEPCTGAVAHAVVLRREGIELAAEVCAAHEQLVQPDVGYVRSIKLRRTVS
jgi:hypothetical protein